MTKIALKVYEPGSEPKLNIFGQPYAKIGTMRDSHIRLSDPLVSRMHAAITDMSVHGEAWIVDLGSDAGTFVNDQWVNRHRLKQGDKIRIGNTLIVVEECS